MKNLRQINEDEDHSLFVAPHIAEFSSLKGGASRHLMANDSDQQLAIKIKCSNNDIYRVSPVYSILKPGASHRLQVIRDPGKPGADKLVILYKPTKCKNAYEAFNNNDDKDLQRSMIALIAHEPPKLASFDEFTIDESNALKKTKTSKEHKPVVNTRPNKSILKR